MSEASALLREMRATPDGGAVMDGAGHVWTKHGDAWTSRTHPVHAARTETLLRGLCPDLADELEGESDE